MKRLAELDALRGLAALNVVLLHFHDMWLRKDVVHLSLHEMRVMTVLTPLYAGNEAVVLFFLLSGLVLALPFEQGQPQRYAVFCTRRITRIYGPYVLAMGLAVAASSVWHGPLHHGAWPSHSWTGPPQRADVLHHLAFIGCYDWAKFDIAIWSLIHEMRISLIFPALWLVTRRLGTALSLGLAVVGTALAALAARYPYDSAVWSLAQTVHYAGFFVVGILLARFWPRLERAMRGKALPLGLASAVCYFGGMGLFMDRVLDRHFSPRVATLLGNWVVLVGASGMLLLAVCAPRLSAMLCSPVPLFLGRVSYSLYLLHFVVLMALTFAAGRLSPWLQFPIYLGLSLGLAAVFYRWVEQPFMALGRRLTVIGPAK